MRFNGNFYSEWADGRNKSLHHPFLVALAACAAGAEMAAARTLRRRRLQTISSTPRLWRKQPTFKDLMSSDGKANALYRNVKHSKKDPFYERFSDHACA